MRSDGSPFSLQLSRIFVIVVWLGLLLGDVLNGLWGTQMVFGGSPTQRVVVGSLFIFPTIGALAAGAAMLSPQPQDRKGLDGRGILGLPRYLYEPHMRLSVVASKLDMVWHVSGTATLLTYLGVLIAGCIQPIELPDPSTSNSSHTVLLGYSMLASVLVTTLFCVGSRYAYVGLLYPLGIGYLARLEGSFGWESVVPVTFLLTFNLTLVASLTLLYNRGTLLDKAVTELERRRGAEAKAQAEHIARRRADSYVHDNILSVLTPVATGFTEGESLRKAAQKALESLESDGQNTGLTTVVQLFASIEQAALQRDGCLTINLGIERSASRRTLAPEVCGAFQGVVAEAINNSLRHANRSDGISVRRTLEMRATGSLIEVVVQDDGDSCDRGAFTDSRSSRHGINISILGRMRDIGGGAVVSCQPRGPHQGVRVEAAWEQPSAVGLLGTSVDTTDFSISSAAQTWVARAIAAWAFVGTVIMIVGQASRYSSLVLPVVALILQAAAAVLLVRTWPLAVVRDWAMWFAVGVVGVSNLLALIPILGNGYPGHAAWSLGTGWLLCVLILLRSGPVPSWIAMVLLGISTWVWTLLSGLSAMIAVELVLGQAISLFLWTLVAWWSEQIMMATARTDLQIHDAEVLRASTRATRTLLDKRLEGVTQRARPVLEELASDNELDSDMQLTATVLEGELRDEIRAPALCSERLVMAAREARYRGVEVVFLDDSSSPVTAGLLGQVSLRAIEEIRATESGRIVVRLLPENRRHVATIVASGREVVAIGADRQG
ncbi:MAG: hypothetical protein WAS54_09355 [Scrofimicrobium sp.]